MLTVDKVTGGYAGDTILHDISFQVESGELYGILGPNGSGKTTLLKMISGILPLQNGSIFLKNKDVVAFSAKQLAKLVAVLPQETSQAFSYSVKDTVSLGRYAHQHGWFQTWSRHDEEVVQRVMEHTGITAFQHRNIQELSGGERQRVYLAQALAQEPELLLLDEPTNHLDLSFQKELLDLLKSWTQQQALTVVSIFHDLNLAGLYCDKLLLLENGKVYAEGAPSEVLKEHKIKSVYKTDIKKHPHPNVPVPQLMLLPKWGHEEESKQNEIEPTMLQVTEERIVLQAKTPLRVMSSGVVGAGVGWYTTFVNRRVDVYYDHTDHRTEMRQYLERHGYTSNKTVGMMTAVCLEDVAFTYLQDNTQSFSMFVVVTAGVGNAIDASKSSQHSYDYKPGTINTWIFINGHLTEEAFIQSIMTATEAKVKALHDQKVRDKVTGTLATGTPTDSILVAATQKGVELEYAGTITPLGKMISKGVYDCIAEAIGKYRRRHGIL
ncbi:ATP-binding cassette domain-containing protein [Bacillus sp. HMF5848]|uniref:adenosylcobinamide amidohydrolase n=1 Tax=Bacillus sp. HMF5848 TaxID=2495421 RepID=UPI000F786E87|nr:adenosylcobinamide amidohydrolase [Bacillus sp. HMF5848]RSK25795.1 ATP-binding cassette domain-containing protein [Bacillus sp. HMF5848]